MRWQQGLRWLIAAAGVSFAVYLYLHFDHRKPVAHAPLPPALPSGASYQSKMGPKGKQCRFDNGKEISCISFTEFTQYNDGRRVIEHPVFEGDRAGKPFVITADRGELRAAAPNAEPNEIPDETHLLGHVVMHEQDGRDRHRGRVYSDPLRPRDAGRAHVHRDRLVAGVARMRRGAQLLPSTTSGGEARARPPGRQTDGQSADGLNRVLCRVGGTRRGHRQDEGDSRRQREHASHRQR